MIANILIALALFLGVAAVCAQVCLNLKVVAESEAEDKLREANARNAELADRLSRSYSGAAYSVRGQMYRD